MTSDIPVVKTRVEIELIYNSSDQSQRRWVEKLLRAFPDDINYKDLKVTAVRESHREYKHRVPCLKFSKIHDGTLLVEHKEKGDCVKYIQNWLTNRVIDVPPFLVPVHSKKVIKADSNGRRKKHSIDISFDDTSASSSSSSSTSSPPRKKSDVQKPLKSRERLALLEEAVKELQFQIQELQCQIGSYTEAKTLKTESNQQPEPALSGKGVIVESPIEIILPKEEAETDKPITPGERRIQDMLRYRQFIYKKPNETS